MVKPKNIHDDLFGFISGRILFARVILLLIILVIVMGFCGCYTERQCAKLYPPKEIVKEKYYEKIRDSVIAGSTVYDTLYLDSIAYFPVNKWMTIYDTSGRAELRFMRDENGRLIAQCIAKDLLIQKIDRMLDSQSKERVVIEVMPTWYKIMVIIVAIALAIIAIKSFKGK